MAVWPLRGIRPARAVDLMRASSARSGVTLTAAAVAHTKPATYTTVIASTSGDASLMLVYLSATRTDATNTSALLDIAIGAAASETIIVPDLGVGYANSSLDRCPMWAIPVNIPAGTRISARLQSAVALATGSISMDLYGAGPFEKNTPLRVGPALGLVSASSRGTILTASSSTNVKGSWVELISSTVDPYFGFLYSMMGAGSAAITAANMAFDIGVGGAGSESVLVADLVGRVESDEHVHARHLGTQTVWLESPVPAGTRISARVSATSASNTMDLILHGLRK